MAKKPPLRAVDPSERAPEKPAPKNITEALGGSSRDVLGAMRSALAKQLDSGGIAGNSIAAAYRELRELDRLIRVIDAEAAEEERRNASSNGERRSFNSSAI